MNREKEGWHFVSGTKAPHWIDLYWFEHGEPWAKASVKWDGCIHLNNVSHYPYEIGKPATETQLEEYSHICDIDDYIKQLELLRDKAKEHFGEWPR